MQPLATRMRPKTFDDVVGQDTTIKVLKRQLETNSIKHCYLFCGASGCGKTTVARIFSREINKFTDDNGEEHSSEPIEIDGASNNGVENVRDIIKTASERSLDGEYKIFIVDECHALSSTAWQAFLKCIEETPKYTIFIFCTTEPQKLPETILNRCMRFNFLKISQFDICSKLKDVCEAENYTNYSEVIDYVSRVCDGKLRDALSYLEHIADYDKNLSMESAYKTLGTSSYETMFDLLFGLISGNDKDVLNLISEMSLVGMSPEKFTDEFLRFVLDILKYVLLKDFRLIKIPESNVDNLNKISSMNDINNYLIWVSNKLLSLKQMLKSDTNQIDTFEVVMLQISRCQ